MSSATLKTRLSDAVKDAMRAKASERLATLRFLLAAVKQKEVDERRDLTDAEITAIIEKQVKQRRESIAAFEQAGRTETAEQEKAELVVLQEFLPQAATPEEVAAAIDAALAEVAAQGVTGAPAMGKVMALLKQSLAGRADMTALSQQVKGRLAWKPPASAIALDAVAPPLRGAMRDCVEAINIGRRHFESRYDTTLADPLKADPDALRRLSDAIAPVIEALAAAPDNGYGWGCGGGSPLAYREARKVTLGLWRGSHHSSRPDADGALDYSRCLYLLFQAARLSPAGMAQAVAGLHDDIVFNHVTLHIIEDALALAAQDGAGQAARGAAVEPYVQQLRTTHIFREEDNRYQGYRILLRDAADHGDAAAALKLLPQCNTRSERDEIAIIKSRLVASVSARDGLQAALDLCDHKRIGPAFREYALRPVVDAGQYQAVQAALTAHPDLASADSGDGLAFLVPAFCQQQKKAADPPDTAQFDALFERVNAMNPKLKHGDARLRDWLLLELGLASRDKAYIARCRKAIKHNSIKRELDSA